LSHIADLYAYRSERPLSSLGVGTVPVFIAIDGPFLGNELYFSIQFQLSAQKGSSSGPLRHQFFFDPPTFSTRLKADCFCRTPYQRNDYLMWINNAAKDETKASRLDKMLSELKQGHGYMGMDWGLK
jgi:hypothetical protein